MFPSFNHFYLYQELIYDLFYSSLVYTNTFIQVLSTILPENTMINSLDSQTSKYPSTNTDAIMLDLKELRRVFKEHMKEHIIIPRSQWNNTRFKLVSNKLIF